MAAFSGTTTAFQNMPALSFAWDGAAVPALTVKEVSDGSTAAVITGQALARAASAPAALLAAAAPAGQNPREALLW
jgi:hypothetical protein